MFRLVSILLTLALAGAGPIAAQPASEQVVRAAMVYNFLKFTEFPAETAPDSQRLRLCFSVGDPTQADALEALAGRKVGNRELVVTRLSNPGERCQALYVDSRQRWSAAIDSRILGSPLAISNYRGFLEDGGTIEIDMQSDGNRFEVSLTQVRLARLRLSPQLLRLARRVHE